jgi:hypothetical protein
VKTTRAEAARELRERVLRGPAFSDTATYGHGPLTEREVSEQYRRWAESWVLPLVERLVPELKGSAR